MTTEQSPRKGRQLLLNAGPIESEEDLDRQLGIEHDKAVNVLILLGALAGFFIGIILAVVAGLSYSHWKHLVF